MIVQSRGVVPPLSQPSAIPPPHPQLVPALGPFHSCASQSKKMVIQSRSETLPTSRSSARFHSPLSLLPHAGHADVAMAISKRAFAHILTKEPAGIKLSHKEQLQWGRSLDIFGWPGSVCCASPALGITAQMGASQSNKTSKLKPSPSPPT